MSISKDDLVGTAEAVAAAITEHLSVAAKMLAATTGSAGRLTTDDAEIITRLDLILEKLDSPGIPLSEQLWDLAMVARYLHRNPQTVRESMACLPSFPKAIRLPSEGRSHPLYNAAEVIKWAKTFKDKR